MDRSPQTTTPQRRRTDRPTVEIPHRTVAECAALWATYQAQRADGIEPTVQLDR